MAKGKNSKKNAAANRRRNKEKAPEIICPECEGKAWDFRHDKRRIPSKWQLHVGVAITCIIFWFVPNMQVFAAVFAGAYIAFTLWPRKVIVGTCKKCGHEELFNAPKDGTLHPVFGDDIYKL